MSTYINQSDRHRAEAVLYENAANKAANAADDLIIAGDMRAAAIMLDRAATHYRMAAAARRRASTLPGGTGVDRYIADALARYARDYSDRTVTAERDCAVSA